MGVEDRVSLQGMVQTAEDTAVVCACVRLNELIARVLFLMWLN